MRILIMEIPSLHNLLINYNNIGLKNIISIYFMEIDMFD